MTEVCQLWAQRSAIVQAGATPQQVIRCRSRVGIGASRYGCLVEDVLPCSPEQFLVYANHACTSIDRGLHTVCRAHLFLVKTIAEI